MKFKCRLCQEEFMRKDALKRHSEGGKQREPTCPYAILKDQVAGPGDGPQNISNQDGSLSSQNAITSANRLQHMGQDGAKEGAASSDTIMAPMMTAQTQNQNDRAFVDGTGKDLGKCEGDNLQKEPFAGIAKFHGETEQVDGRGNAVFHNNANVSETCFLAPKSKLDSKDDEIEFLKQQIRELQSQSTQNKSNSEGRSQYSGSSLVGSAGDLKRQQQHQSFQEDPHKQCNVLVLALQQQIKELKDEKIALQEKLDLKDQEWKAKESGWLKILQDKLDLKDRELKAKESEWLKIFKELYTISKQDSNFAGELKQKLQSFQESISASLNQSPTPSQDSKMESDSEEQIFLALDVKLKQLGKIMKLEQIDMYCGTSHIDTSTIPETVCTTYSDLSVQGFSEILKLLTQQSDDYYKLKQVSSFLDIGAGTGRCVYQAALTVGCSTTGIEYDAMKVSASHRVQTEYEKKYGEEPLFNLVQLDEGDFSEKMDFNPCTHLYSYNPTWPSSVMGPLIKVLNQTNFRVLVWAKGPKDCRALANVRMIDKIKCKNVGGDNETFYIYHKHKILVQSSLQQMESMNGNIQHLINLNEQHKVNADYLRQQTQSKRKKQSKVDEDIPKYAFDPEAQSELEQKRLNEAAGQESIKQQLKYFKMMSAQEQLEHAQGRTFDGGDDLGVFARNAYLHHDAYLNNCDNIEGYYNRKHFNINNVPPGYSNIEGEKQKQRVKDILARKTLKVTPTNRKREEKMDEKIKGKKNPKLVAARRDATKKIVDVLAKHQKELVTIQEIHEQLFQQYAEQTKLKLKPLDDPFNDGILFPRTKLTQTIEQVKHRFEDEEVGLNAKTVKPSMKEKYWFVKLNEDATLSIPTVKKRLLILMKKLRNELGEAVYCCQFDRTLDSEGYFYCRNPKQFAQQFQHIGLEKAGNRSYNTFSTCIQLVQQHKDTLDQRINIVDRRFKIYNKTLHPLFAVESVQKTIGIGSSAFFHSSSRFYQRHRRSYKTGRLRIEESTYLKSVEEEETFLSSGDDNVFNEIVKVIETCGKPFIRFIQFDECWNFFWASIKKHFFVFEDRKVAVVYFYNSETCQYVGPLYDAGPRFDKEACKKRYSIFGKEAIVIDVGKESSFTKETDLHQFPISPLNQNHEESHAFKELKNWKYRLVDEEVVSIKLKTLMRENEEMNIEKEFNEENVTALVVEKRKLKDGIKKKYLLINKVSVTNQQFWFQSTQGSKSTLIINYEAEDGSKIVRRGNDYYLLL